MRTILNMDVADVIAKTFKVCNTEGEEVTFKANAAQLAFESKADRYKRHIIMKSRQQGMTTWIVARHLLFSLANPDHVSVSLMQSAEAAEHVSHMAARMLDSADVHYIRSHRRISMENGSSYYTFSAQHNFPRGESITINNLHISELSRWDTRWADNLDSARAFLSRACEEVVESTPYQIGDLFYREWESAVERRVIRHFFPWWMGDKNEALEAAIKSTLTDEECGLIVREGLSLKQITQRRKIRQIGPDAMIDCMYLEEVPWNKKKGN